jgi:hypothetical protein
MKLSYVYISMVLFEVTSFIQNGFGVRINYVIEVERVPDSYHMTPLPFLKFVYKLIGIFWISTQTQDHIDLNQSL